MATILTAPTDEQAIGDSYRQAIEVLDAELRQLDGVCRGLKDDEWAMSTKLVPFDPTQKHWTVFELDGHFDISIGLARMLMAERKDGQPGRDRVSFFIFPRSEVAPVVYDYAYQMVEGKTARDMPGVLHETISKPVEEAKKTAPDHVGPGYYAQKRADEFISSRVVEAVVHGMDLTDAL